MKQIFLLGLLILIVALLSATVIKNKESSIIDPFIPDSTYSSKLSFSIPDKKLIYGMLKTGINLVEFGNKKSIILWIGIINTNYVPNQNDFFIDPENNIYIHIKSTEEKRDYRIKFDFANQTSNKQSFNSNGKLEKLIHFTTFINGVEKQKQYTGNEWMTGITGSIKMYPINSNTKVYNNSEPNYFSIFPPMFFSTVHQEVSSKIVGTSSALVPARQWYQIISMPSLEDLIKMLDEPIKQNLIKYIFANRDRLDFAYCLKSQTLKSISDELDNQKDIKLIAAQTKANEMIFDQIRSKAIIFYAKEINNDLSKSPLFLPKDEFESTENFHARQMKREEYKKEIEKKYTLIFKDAEERKQVNRKEKIKNSYTHVNLKIKELGTYNTERQSFQITFDGFRPMELDIPFQDAKSFKDKLTDVIVVVDKQLMEDTITYQFFNFEVTHPITGVKYNLNKRSPLYLDYISNDIADTGIPKLETSIAFKEPSGNNLLDGDEKAKFEVTIRNSGTGTARNVNVNLSSNDNEGFTYDKAKLLTGIAPNQSQTLIFEINAGRRISSKEIPFKFVITESKGFNPADILYSINSQAFKTPNLAVKDIGIKEVTGNNNSIIENGEKIEVSVLVQNTGQGKTENSKAVFDIMDKNILTLSPDKMVQNIGELQPGESRLLTFDFTVNNIYSGSDQLPIKVVLSEKYNEYGGTFPLKLEMKKVQLASKNIKLSGQYDQKIDIKDISLTAETDKNIPETGVKNENRYALIIGNEDYKNSQPDLNSEINVLFAENDAKTLKEYSVKTLGVPEENITLLINATAGKMKQYLAKINLIAKNSNGKAELIFYYAGHGLPDENTKEPYLIPVDVSGSNFKEGGIKLAEVYTKLTEYPTKKVTVFIDACFSGGARNQGLLSTRSIKMKPKESILTGNIVVFSASNGEQSSLPYTDKQHGMFTYFLLKKIQDTKGEISLKDLFDSINEKVSLQSVNINNKEQTPVVNSGTDSWGNWTLR